MPQMAPLNWLSLMMMFIFILMLFNLMNYYLYFPSPKKSIKTSMLKKINWKW